MKNNLNCSMAIGKDPGGPGDEDRSVASPSAMANMSLLSTLEKQSVVTVAGGGGPKDEYIQRIDERVNQKIAKGMKKAVHLILGKFDDMCQQKMKLFLKEEVDSKLAEIRRDINELRELIGKKDDKSKSQMSQKTLASSKHAKDSSQKASQATSRFINSPPEVAATGPLGDLCNPNFDSTSQLLQADKPSFLIDFKVDSLPPFAPDGSREQIEEERDKKLNKILKKVENVVDQVKNQSDLQNSQQITSTYHKGAGQLHPQKSLSDLAKSQLHSMSKSFKGHPSTGKHPKNSMSGSSSVSNLKGSGGPTLQKTRSTQHISGGSNQHAPHTDRKKSTSRKEQGSKKQGVEKKKKQGQSGVKGRNSSRLGRTQVTVDVSNQEEGSGNVGGDKSGQEESGKKDGGYLTQVNKYLELEQKTSQEAPQLKVEVDQTVSESMVILDDVTQVDQSFTLSCLNTTMTQAASMNNVQKDTSDKQTRNTEKASTEETQIEAKKSDSAELKKEKTTQNLQVGPHQKPLPKKSNRKKSKSKSKNAREKKKESQHKLSAEPVIKETVQNHSLPTKVLDQEQQKQQIQLQQQYQLQQQKHKSTYIVERYEDFSPKTKVGDPSRPSRQSLIQQRSSDAPTNIITQPLPQAMNGLDFLAPFIVPSTDLNEHAVPPAGGDETSNTQLSQSNNIFEKVQQEMRQSVPQNYMVTTPHLSMFMNRKSIDQMATPQNRDDQCFNIVNEDSSQQQMFASNDLGSDEKLDTNGNQYALQSTQLQNLLELKEKVVVESQEIVQNAQIEPLYLLTLMKKPDRSVDSSPTFNDKTTIYLTTSRDFVSNNDTETLIDNIYRYFMAFNQNQLMNTLEIFDKFIFKILSGTNANNPASILQKLQSMGQNIIYLNSGIQPLVGVERPQMLAIEQQKAKGFDNGTKAGGQKLEVQDRGADFESDEKVIEQQEKVKEEDQFQKQEVVGEKSILGALNQDIEKIIDVDKEKQEKEEAAPSISDSEVIAPQSTFTLPLQKSNSVHPAQETSALGPEKKPSNSHILSDVDSSKPPVNRHSNLVPKPRNSIASYRQSNGSGKKGADTAGEFAQKINSSKNINTGTHRTSNQSSINMNLSNGSSSAEHQKEVEEDLKKIEHVSECEQALEETEDVPTPHQPPTQLQTQSQDAQDLFLQKFDSNESDLPAQIHQNQSKSVSPDDQNSIKEKQKINQQPKLNNFMNDTPSHNSNTTSVFGDQAYHQQNAHFTLSSKVQRKEAEIFNQNETIAVNGSNGVEFVDQRLMLHKRSSTEHVADVLQGANQKVDFYNNNLRNHEKYITASELISEQELMGLCEEVATGQVDNHHKIPDKSTTTSPAITKSVLTHSHQQLQKPKNSGRVATGSSASGSKTKRSESKANKHSRNSSNFKKQAYQTHHQHHLTQQILPPRHVPTPSNGASQSQVYSQQQYLNNVAASASSTTSAVSRPSQRNHQALSKSIIAPPKSMQFGQENISQTKESHNQSKKTTSEQVQQATGALNHYSSRQQQQHLAKNSFIHHSNQRSSQASLQSSAAFLPEMSEKLAKVQDTVSRVGSIVRSRSAKRAVDSSVGRLTGGQQSRDRQLLEQLQAQSSRQNKAMMAVGGQGTAAKRQSSTSVSKTRIDSYKQVSGATSRNGSMQKRASSKQKDKGYGAVDKKFNNLLMGQEQEKFGDRCPTGFKKVGLLGKGGAAIVWLAEVNSHKKYSGHSMVALKQFPKTRGKIIDSSAKTEIDIGNILFPFKLRDGCDGSKSTDFKRGTALSADKHPGMRHISKFLDQIEDPRDVWLVYEVGPTCLRKALCDVKGEFHKGERIYRIQHLQFYNRLLTNKSALKSFIVKVAEALDVLQHFGIVHSDLKPDNILVELTQSGNDVNSVKLIDFGTSFQFHRATQVAGTTPEYLAPEILKSLDDRNNPQKVSQQLTSKCKPWSFDIWSLGIILLEIATGCPVWMSLKCRVQTIDGKSHFCSGLFGVPQREVKKIMGKQNQVLKNLNATLKKFECYGLDEDHLFMDLLARMLCEDPMQRIAPCQIVQHKFCQKQ